MAPDVNLRGPHGKSTSQKQRYCLGAFGVVQTAWGEVQSLAKRLGPPGGKPFPPALLKSSDEQTVVGLAAVLRAIEQFHFAGESFFQWGVIAAPRFLGRMHASELLHKFETGGVWKASPMFVPHYSLHSVSGTISQALKINGPNFGVGGGTHAVAEGLLGALSLLDNNHLPGLWVVLTQCDPEPRPDRSCKSELAVECYAIAMAFVPDQVQLPVQYLSLAPIAAHANADATTDDNAFFRLFEHLSNHQEKTKRDDWVLPLNWGYELRLSNEQSRGMDHWCGDHQPVGQRLQHNRRESAERHVRHNESR